MTINPSILCLISAVYQPELSPLPPSTEVRTICTSVDSIMSAQPMDSHPFQCKANLSMETYKMLHYLGPFLLLTPSGISCLCFPSSHGLPTPPFLKYTISTLHGGHCIFCVIFLPYHTANAFQSGLRGCLICMLPSGNTNLSSP